MLLQNDYYRVERLPLVPVVKVARSAVPFETVDDVERGCAPVQRALDLEGREKVGLLIDTREALGRNDPKSEQIFAKHRKLMVLGFRRVAILVSTPTGLLHTKRLLTTDQTHTHTQVFMDEREALTYLTAFDFKQPVRP